MPNSRVTTSILVFPNGFSNPSAIEKKINIEINPARATNPA
jgi:hypothetical protein